ncbi:DUF1349 domain-containing protein [Cesiribacter andamanensis]|uniref:DUF1349 domain-containing protein n=1 Tax=Cesiribacter andamanensis AMV16 TaxID=1279009 RepID=M7N1G3_9BACT|nr:DUF1349 domain-containing protein [Cesiribacter andamanensis]EMR01132.1 hypothetical protein ADICEAN_03736 [Cesiribacter andamanensis AMV16]
MKCIFLTALAMGIAGTLYAQQPASTAAPASAALNDDFSSAESLVNWIWFHQTEGWPDKMNRLTVENGRLVFEPGTSGWFADYQAPFLYKEVRGDFDVRMRIKAEALGGGISHTTWSLGGLMVRVPKRSTKENWQPRQENWFFITTGVAANAGEQVIESKYTLNSKSNLKLRPARAEWITLRAVRVGHAFILLYQYEGEHWQVHERFYIADWPPVLQVGINGYTNSEALPQEVRFGDALQQNSTVYTGIGKNDLRLLVDWVQFKMPVVSFSETNRAMEWYNNVARNTLTDYSLTNEALLAMLGD